MSQPNFPDDPAALIAPTSRLEEDPIPLSAPISNLEEEPMPLAAPTSIEQKKPSDSGLEDYPDAAPLVSNS